MTVIVGELIVLAQDQPVDPIGAQVFGVVNEAPIATAEVQLAPDGSVFQFVLQLPESIRSSVEIVVPQMVGVAPVAVELSGDEDEIHVTLIWNAGGQTYG